MKFFLTAFAALLFAFGAAGCGDDHKDHDHGDEVHGEHDGHDHADGEHEDHGEHDEHGERHELGTVDCGGFKLTVAVLGEIAAGEEGVLQIDVEGDDPAVLRAWIGVESGKGSLKAKLEIEDGAYHGHVEVPATLADGSAIWVETEDADGKKAAASLPLE